MNIFSGSVTYGTGTLGWELDQIAGTFPSPDIVFFPFQMPIPWTVTVVLSIAGIDASNSAALNVNISTMDVESIGNEFNIVVATAGDTLLNSITINWLVYATFNDSSAAQ